MARSNELKCFGSGVGFPFRVNNSTGGTVVTTGNTDSVSVALEYLQDSWSIRETVRPDVNHIAESISHILLTVPGEHDTLPEFGSYIFTILFEPNTFEFRQLAEVYFKTSTFRWEKRAFVPNQFETYGYDVDPNKYGRYSGVRWSITGRQVDLGIAPIWVTLDFIPAQVAGNLVQPFVSDFEARAQEYNPGSVDSSGHDSLSRYYGCDTCVGADRMYSRIKHLHCMQNYDNDIYYVVVRDDTWLSISWKFYKDIRYWHIISSCFVADNTDNDRSTMNMLPDPAPGQILRIPSKARVLAERYNA